VTVPVDITDARLIKAYAHPLRLQILSLLDNRVASPKQIATELDTPLPNTAYHVRQLASLGLVELVRRTARGGAIEHHYTARVRPTVPDEVWATLPEIVKRAYSGGLLQEAITQMVAAAEEDGFLAPESHFTRTPGRLDAKGWKAVSKEMLKTLERIERIVEDSEARLAASPDDEGKTANIVMAFFEQAEAKAVGARSAGVAPAPRSTAPPRAKAARGRRSEPAA
jgi:DNA-binding transcriptional ArsR family regulator